jgi:hypothetical protein
VVTVLNVPEIAFAIVIVLSNSGIRMQSLSGQR